MKIKMLKDVTVETIGHNDEGYISRENTDFRKDEIVEVEILKEKKGMAEMKFKDDSKGKMLLQDFEKVS
jgi:hypothetical protein